MFLISKNNRIQKASFFAAALSDRSFIDVIAFTFTPIGLWKQAKYFVNSIGSWLAEMVVKLALVIGSVIFDCFGLGVFDSHVIKPL